METGLTDIELESITKVLKHNAKVRQAVLFGSRAMGNYKPGSDVDIALKGEDLTYSDLIELLLNIDALTLPFKVDLVHFDKIEDPEVIAHIESVGKTL